MDNTDKNILKLLQLNARISNKDLAKETGLSTTPVFERVKKLEKNGVIKNYVAIVDQSKLNMNLTSFVSVKLEKHSKGHLMQFQGSINRLGEVMECYHVAGNTDYVLKVLIEDIQAYKKFITEKMSAIENIASLETLFVMDEIKKETAVPLN